MIEQGPHRGMSALYWLARKNEHPLLEKMIDSGVTIDSKALNHIIEQGPNKGISALYGLARSETGRPLLQKIIDNKVTIESQTLNHIIQEGPKKGTSALQNLSRSSTGHDILYMTVKLGVIIGGKSITPKTIINLFQSRDLANILGSNPCIRQRFDDNPKTFCANTTAIKVVRGLFTSGHNVRDSILNYEAKTQTGKSLSAIGSFFKSKAGTELFKEIFSSGDLPESVRSKKITCGKYKGSTVAFALDDLRDIQGTRATSASGQVSVTDVSETLFSTSDNSGTQLNANSASKK